MRNVSSKAQRHFEMFKKLLSRILSDKPTELRKGLGTPELPFEIYRGKQPITSNDFKKIVNEIFLPKILELGFEGKDFFFYRENPIYTEVVFFWTYKTGGAIQVDLLVKFNNITYPGDKKLIKTKQIRSINAEFQKRLSPNGEKNRQGQEVWFWIFKDHIEENTKIVEDIWRVFSHRGIEYFNQFQDHSEYLRQITMSNYLDFPDFHINRFFGKHEAGIIYFLFRYWQEQQDEVKTMEFAKLGLTKFSNENDNIYLLPFKNYLDQKAIE